jgi:hypothetical protein
VTALLYDPYWQMFCFLYSVTIQFSYLDNGHDDKPESEGNHQWILCGTSNADATRAPEEVQQQGAKELREQRLPDPPSDLIYSQLLPDARASHYLPAAYIKFRNVSQWEI